MAGTIRLDEDEDVELPDQSELYGFRQCEASERRSKVRVSLLELQVKAIAGLVAVAFAAAYANSSSNEAVAGSGRLFVWRARNGDFYASHLLAARLKWLARRRRPATTLFVAVVVIFDRQSRRRSTIL